MLRLWQILTLATFALLVLSAPTEAEARGTDFTDVEFYMDKTGLGSTYDLSTEQPTSTKPKYWKARDDPNQGVGSNRNYFPLASWEQNLGASLELGDSFSYVIWVESTNVNEIWFKTTLFINWYEYDDGECEEGCPRNSSISIDEVGKSAPFGSFLNENYTMELESSSLDKSDFPNGVPPYTTFGLKLETSVTWQADLENRTVWVKGANPDFDSSFIINFKHVDIADDYTGYFSNDRVDELNEDSLYIKANVTNALGADNLDTSSVSIEIQGLAGGGTFKDSIIAKDKNTYAKYIEGTWWYQEDQGIASGTYSIELSIKDMWGNEWSSRISYELVVDAYGLEIEFDEGYSSNGQLPRGGKVDYEFMVHNRGNTRDIFEVVLTSSLPSDWGASLISQSQLDILEGQSSSVRVRVEAPVSATGGSEESVTVSITSLGDSEVSETVRLDTKVRTYGVAFVSPPDEVIIDPEELDMDGYYRFSINIRNTGSDKDTYILDASTGRPDWSASIETGGTQIDTLTVLKSGTEKVDIVLKPINYDDTFGVREEFQLSATSVSPGDGSATLSLDIIMKIPPDRVVDLSVSVADVLVNGKPQAILTEDDLNSAEPIQFQITIHNNGGKAAGSFGVKLKLGGLVIDEYLVSQGISGFGRETVILNWESPSPGTSTLRVLVDFEGVAGELTSDKGDNSLSLPIFVSEKTATSGDNGEDNSPLLSAPSSVLTFLLLTVSSIFYRRKH
ncbi:MAG: CARDB domain-containing protein [Candidatus Thermoplasmatota archaeon]|nr:CARDB domain-containing protein [Candidatus Thermoplasmatota archaeon]